MPSRTRPNLKIRTITWNMHDSVPTGDLSELLGVLPGPSASRQPTAAPDALPQFTMDALHPYHILLVCGQECPSSRDLLGNTLSWTDRLEDYLTLGDGQPRSSSYPPSPSDPNTPSFSSSTTCSQSSSSATNHPRDDDSGGPYTLVAKERLLGIYLAVFVHNSALDHLTAGPSKSKVTAGLVGGRVGNKGGVGISLLFAGHSFLFVAAHLAAHADRLEERKLNVKKIADELDCDEWETGHWDRNRPISIANADVLDSSIHSHTSAVSSSPSGLKDIGRKLLNLDSNDRDEQDLSRRKKRRANGKSAFDRYDFIFFAGDLNFRLEISRLHADWLMKAAHQQPKPGPSSPDSFPPCRPTSCVDEPPTDPLSRTSGPQDFSDALRFDQLRKVLSEPNGCFEGFEEAEIRFAPTYKYDVLPPLKHKRTAVTTPPPPPPLPPNALHLYIPKRAAKPQPLRMKSTPTTPISHYFPTRRRLLSISLHHSKPASPVGASLRKLRPTHAHGDPSQGMTSPSQSSALNHDQRGLTNAPLRLSRTRSLTSLPRSRAGIPRSRCSSSHHSVDLPSGQAEKIFSGIRPRLKLSPAPRRSTALDVQQSVRHRQSSNRALKRSSTSTQLGTREIVPPESRVTSAHKALGDVQVEEIGTPQGLATHPSGDWRRDSRAGGEEGSVWDSSGKQRVQSWTDRILYRSNIRVMDEGAANKVEGHEIGTGTSAGSPHSPTDDDDPTSSFASSVASSTLDKQPRLRKWTRVLARTLRIEKHGKGPCGVEEEGSKSERREMSQSRSMMVGLMSSSKLPSLRTRRRESSVGRAALPSALETPELVLCPPTLRQPARPPPVSRPPLPLAFNSATRTRSETVGARSLSALWTPRTTKPEASGEGETQTRGTAEKRGRAQSVAAEQGPFTLTSMMAASFFEQARDKDWTSTFSIRNWFQTHLQELIGTGAAGSTEVLEVVDEEVGPRLGECICLAYYSVNDLRAMEAFSDHRPVVGVFVVGIAAHK